MDKQWSNKLKERFLKYVSFYSESIPFVDAFPSSERQWDIAKYLYEELKEIGLEDVSIDDNAYVMGFYRRISTRSTDHWICCTFRYFTGLFG